MAELSSRERMVSATLDLLRQGGWWSAGINQVIEASKAPKGSLYHYFPSGKNELIEAALQQAKQQSGAGLRALFGSSKPLSGRIAGMFTGAAKRLEKTGFSQGCPVAATTLDLGRDSLSLRPVCADVFAHWCNSIAEGLHEFEPGRRVSIAQWILATYEGALMLSRAQASARPLIEAGEFLAQACESMIAVPKAVRPVKPGGEGNDEPASTGATEQADSG